MSVLDEVRWRVQGKSMTDPLWRESVGFTEKTQIIIPIIEEGDLALMNPWPHQQASDAVVTLRVVSSVGQVVASGLEQLLKAEGLNFDLGLRTFDQGLMHRDLPMCVALHVPGSWVKLVAKTGGPALQSAKAAGNASEWLVAKGDLPH